MTKIVVLLPIVSMDDEPSVKDMWALCGIEKRYVRDLS